MVELAVRMVVSLAVVLGLLLLMTRLGARRFKARSGAPVQVLHRQALSRSSSVAVVSVGGRVLVLGTTDQQVRMLAELDPAELEAANTEDLVAATPEAPVAHLVPVPALPEPSAPQRLHPVRSDLPTGNTAGESFAAALLGELGEPEAPRTPGKHRAAVPTVAPVAPVAPVVPAPISPVTGGARAARVAPEATGPLAGSLLSPQTWRSAKRAVSRRAS